MERVPMPSMPFGKYLHNKSGNFYEVVDIVLNVDTQKPHVLYKPLYAHEFGYRLFSREYEDFIQLVNLNDTMKPRFEYISTTEREDK